MTDYNVLSQVSSSFNASTISFLDTKNVAQFVLEAIKQVPLTSVTDLTNQVIQFYPEPIATVISSSFLTSTLSSDSLPHSILKAKPTSDPQLSDFQHRKNESFNTSSSFSFSFSSHPLLNGVSPSAIHKTLNNTDPLFHQQILSALHKTSITPIVFNNASFPPSTPTKNNSNVHPIQKSNPLSSSATTSLSTPSSSAISSFPFPQTIFNRVYTSLSLSSVSVVSFFEHHSHFYTILEQLFFQQSIEIMPSSKKKKSSSSLSTPLRKKLIPIIEITNTPTSRQTRSSTATSSSPINSKTSSSLTVHHPPSPSILSLSSSSTRSIPGTVAATSIQNSKKDKPKDVPFLPETPPSFHTPSLTATRVSSPDQQIKPTSMEVDSANQSDNDVLSYSIKSKRRKVQTAHSTHPPPTLSPCPLVSPSSSLIVIDSNDASPLNSFSNPNFINSSLVKEAKNSLKLSKKNNSSVTSFSKRKGSKLNLFLDELQRGTPTSFVDPTFFSPSMISSLCHALKNQSVQFNLSHASTILSLAMKYINDVPNLDLSVEPDSSTLSLLRTLIDTMEAIDLIFILLLLFPSLTKEELLTSMITNIHDQIRKWIIPLIEYIEKNSIAPAALFSHSSRPSSSSSSSAVKKKEGSFLLDSFAKAIRLREKDELVHNVEEQESNTFFTESSKQLFQQYLYLICHVIHEINEFFSLHSVYLTDSIAISACYGLLYPLFTEIQVDDLLILRAMELVRLIFHLKPDLRIGILDEILCQLIHTVPFLTHVSASDSKKALKVRQYKLLNGQCIHLYSALLFHLVHASVSSKASTLDPSPSLSLHIVHYFLTRATKTTKKADFTNESDYLLLLRHFTEDVFEVLMSPEFPCAELFARTLLQVFLNWIDEEKSHDLPMKSYAMDVFSMILSKLHSFSSLPLSPSEFEYSKSIISNYFSQTCKFDPALYHSFYYFLAEWQMTEKSFNITSSGSSTAHLDSQTDESKNENKEQSHGPNLTKSTSVLSLTTSSSTSSLFGLTSLPSSLEEKLVDRDVCVHHLSLLFPHRLLYQQANPLLLRVLSWFESKDIHIRSRAIRVLSQTIAVNPKVMHRSDVEQAIHSRLLDSSPSVRDSVLEALGKWFVQPTVTPTNGPSLNSAVLPPVVTLTPFYFNILLGRILDKATSVRKRAIKTLAQLHSQFTLEQQIQVAVKFVGRFHDEEESIVKLVRKVLGPFLVPSLPSLTLPSSSSYTSSFSNPSFTLASLSNHEQCLLAHHTQLFCGLVKLLPNSDSFSSYLMDQMNSPSAVCFKALTLSLFQFITHQPDSFDLYVGFHLLIKVNPAWMTIEMFYYFKSELTKCLSSKDAWHIQSIQLSLLHFYLQSQPPIPKKECEELEISVCKIILSGTLLSNVHESVQLLCGLVPYLTSKERFTKLKHHALQSLQSSMKSKFDSKTVSELRRILIILATMYSHPTLSTSKEIHLFVNQVTSLFSRHPLASIYPTMFTCLGWIWMANSELLVQPEAMKLIKQCLETKLTNSSSYALLEAVVEFLYKFMVNEDAASLKKANKGDTSMFDRKIFHSGTDDIKHSGISESLAQCFVKQLVDCALNLHDASQKKLIERLQDLLGYIAMHRLAHPKFVMPAVIALTTSPIPYIAAVAQMQHTKLHAQHRSILYEHFKEAVFATYEYQKGVNLNIHPDGIICSDGKPLALFHAWFQLLQSQKKDRQHFLMQLLSMIFDPPNKHYPFVDLSFMKWISQQLFWLDYKYEEDLMYLIQTVETYVMEHSSLISLDQEDLNDVENTLEEEEVEEMEVEEKEEEEENKERPALRTTKHNPSYDSPRYKTSTILERMRLLLLLKLRNQLIHSFQLRKWHKLSSPKKNTSTKQRFSSSNRTKPVYRVDWDLSQFQFSLKFANFIYLDEKEVLKQLKHEWDQAMINLTLDDSSMSEDPTMTEENGTSTSNETSTSITD